MTVKYREFVGSVSYMSKIQRSPICAGVPAVVSQPPVAAPASGVN